MATAEIAGNPSPLKALATQCVARRPSTNTLQPLQDNTPDEIKDIYKEEKFNKRAISVRFGWGNQTFRKILEGQYPSGQNGFITRERAEKLVKYQELWVEALNENLADVDWMDVFKQYGGTKRIHSDIALKLGLEPLVWSAIWDSRIDGIDAEIIAEAREAEEYLCRSTNEEVMDVHVESAKLPGKEGSSDRTQYIKHGGMDPDTGMANDRRRSTSGDLNVHIGVSHANNPNSDASGALSAIETEISGVFGSPDSECKRITVRSVHSMADGARDEVRPEFVLCDRQPDPGNGGDSARQATPALPSKPVSEGVRARKDKADDQLPAVPG